MVLSKTGVQFGSSSGMDCGVGADWKLTMMRVSGGLDEFMREERPIQLSAWHATASKELFLVSVA